MRKFVGAVMILITLVVFGLLIRLVLPAMQTHQKKQMSDARGTKGTINVALDSWIGYFPIRSPEMQRQFRASGWRVNVIDDAADYRSRMEKLQKGEIQFAVATIDSNIINAAPLNFPGVIIAVIDESNGGDAILARQDVIKTLDDIKGKDVSVAYTQSSPSHHLLKVVSQHFNTPELLPIGAKSIQVQGSGEAYKKLISGSADVAVLWEPDVSRALSQQGIVKIIGTDEMSGAIVDILTVGTEFARSNADAVQMFLKSYFTTLKFYRDHPEKLKEDIIRETNSPPDAVESMLKGVRWVTLTENCEEWFGIAAPGKISNEKIIDSIHATVGILQQNNDFKKDPLPDGDPYRITYKTFLENLYVNDLVDLGSGDAVVGDSLSLKFTTLSEQRWDKLQEVGTLKIKPITFQSGTAQLSIEGKQALDELVEHLRHYPSFRIDVRGHTSDLGDSDANRELSRQRAEAVARYIRVTYNTDENRIRIRGFGGDRPLPRQPGESLRAWRYKLPRVEVALLREVY